MSVTAYRARLGRLSEQVSDFLKPVYSTRLRKVALLIIGVYLFIGILGPLLPLPDPFTSISSPSGEYARLESPSLAHPLGTTEYSYSVLSQTVHAFRTSLIVGFASAFLVILIGVNIGLVAGYYGGKVEAAFMGLTDVVYGLPFYPFAIVLIALFGTGILNIAIVIALVFWRDIARVTRSETLSLKERMFVKSSRAAGTPDSKIMYFHILPNLIPLIILYFVFGITWGILLEASLSFIGLGDPNMISWGLMIHHVFSAGLLTSAWWWTLPPAISLWLLICSLYIVARSLEDHVETNVR